jgi:hypothetical protein
MCMGPVMAKCGSVISVFHVGCRTPRFLHMPTPKIYIVSLGLAMFGLGSSVKFNLIATIY